MADTFSLNVVRNLFLSGIARSHLNNFVCAHCPTDESVIANDIHTSEDAHKILARAKFPDIVVLIEQNDLLELDVPVAGAFEHVARATDQKNLVLPRHVATVDGFLDGGLVQFGGRCVFDAIQFSDQKHAVTV